MSTHYPTVREQSLDRQVGDLMRQRDELLAVLRDLEWLGLNDGRGVTHRQCPACSALHSRSTGHNPYCGLAAAIAKAEGE